MYHSYGGTLNVYLESTMTAEGEKLVWSLSGNKGYRWFKGEVNIGSATGTYQVHLQLFKLTLFRGCLFYFHIML